jgi:hypothetical protein
LAILEKFGAKFASQGPYRARNALFSLEYL